MGKIIKIAIILLFVNSSLIAQRKEKIEDLLVKYTDEELFACFLTTEKIRTHLISKLPIDSIYIAPNPTITIAMRYEYIHGGMYNCFLQDQKKFVVKEGMSFLKKNIELLPKVKRWCNTYIRIRKLRQMYENYADNEFQLDWSTINMRQVIFDYWIRKIEVVASELDGGTNICGSNELIEVYIVDCLIEKNIDQDRFIKDTLFQLFCVIEKRSR